MELERNESDMSSLKKPTAVDGDQHNRPPPIARPPPKRRLQWKLLARPFSFCFSALWAGANIALLAVNFTDHIVGPSLWCPLNHCNSHAWDGNAIEAAIKLDKDDHNALGALQFAAKALEVWFVLISTALVYNLIMAIAQSREGLPIGYILAHIEFNSVDFFLNAVPWTAPNPHRGKPDMRDKTVRRLMYLTIFIFFLTLLSNLMGPATAVLVIPTLQWIDTARNNSQVFNNLQVDRPPQGELALNGCSVEALAASNYSCSYAEYGIYIDHGAASVMLLKNESQKKYGAPIAGTSQESSLQFLLNATVVNNLKWTPNRQVLQRLSEDIFMYLAPDQYGMPPTSINDSLALRINRQGPATGINPWCSVGNITKKNVGTDRNIYCYDLARPKTAAGRPLQDSPAAYTRCYRVGRGFADTNKLRTFHLGTSNSSSSSPFSTPPSNQTSNSSEVETFFSDKVTYFRAAADFHKSDLKRCIDNYTATASCDFDTLFDSNMATVVQDVRNLTSNVSMVSYSLPNPPADIPASARVACENVAYLGFPTYSFDAAITSTNPSYLAVMQGLTPWTPNSTLAVDPDWLLALLSVEPNGTVPGNREIAQTISSNLVSQWDGGLNAQTAENNGNGLPLLTLLHLIMMVQMHSIVPYNFSDIFHPTASAHSLIQPNNGASRILQTWATRRVWAFGTSSRTFKLGAVVVILGILCVFVHLYMEIYHHQERRSPVELFIAALRREYKGEMDNEVVGEDRTARYEGKTRYRLTQGLSKGNLHFEPQGLRRRRGVDV